MNRSACWMMGIAVVVLAGCQPGQETPTTADTPKPVPVTVAEAKTVTVRRTVPVTGTLYPFEDVLLAPRVGGRVERVYHDVGDRIGPGELLLELDAYEYRLAVEQARAAYEAELRRLKLTALPELGADLEQIVARVDTVIEAKANLGYAEAELKREEKLIGVAGAAQAYDTAVNRLAVAKARLQLAETDARVMLANARRLKAALDDAERRLADTKLAAPHPAEWKEWLQLLGPSKTPLQYAVAQKMVSPGEMVQSMPVTNCFRLVIDHILKLTVAVPEKHAPEVAVGQKVEVRVQAYGDRVFEGVIARINPTIDVTSRTFSIIIYIRNGDGELKAGGFATAEIITRNEEIVVVPPEALVQFAGVNKVFVVEGTRAQVVEVKVGTREKQWIEVIGLPAGAKVITSGQTQLIDGSPIRIR
ncbi:MAG: efflux RND transporter periplasmic adaptor subunit [Gemmataceae bacterium]|nr:efflux RND transporter periplasmic adaptor subunit [Gemmata sp.]MDW8198599.1 efflux RND transporter periplasmic adaptor subunit [Gemmataceae bacterium]